MIENKPPHRKILASKTGGPREKNVAVPNRDGSRRRRRGRDVHVCGVDGASQASTHRNTDSLADEGAELRVRPAGRLEQA